MASHISETGKTTDQAGIAARPNLCPDACTTIMAHQESPSEQSDHAQFAQVNGYLTVIIIHLATGQRWTANKRKEITVIIRIAPTDH